MTIRTGRFLTASLCASLLTVGALACGDGSSDNPVESAARTIEGNVEDAVKTYEDEEAAAKARGENEVEAAGDAYNAVLDRGKEKAGE